MAGSLMVRYQVLLQQSIPKKFRAGVAKILEHSKLMIK